MTRAVTSLVKIEWSKDELVMLIEVYKGKEILWNLRHPGYSKRGMREIALRDIVAQFPGKDMLQDVFTGTVLLQ